jgi:hypothetical protein
MTLQSASLSFSNASAAAFKAWGQGVGNLLGACAALQKTTDTGQIDWSTNPAVPGSNAAAGYEVYRFKDALQSTAPIFLKLEYGNGSSTNPLMWITIGTGSDGAGTITSTFFGSILSTTVTRQVIPPSSMLSSFAGATTYLNSDAGGFALFAAPSFASTSSSGTLLLVERTRAFDGTATGDGFAFINAAAGNGGVNFYVPISYLANSYTPTQAGTVQTWHAGSNLAGGASLIFGGVMYAQPVFTGFNVKLGGPSQFVMAVTATDIVGGATFTFTHYGTSQTWMAAGYGQSSTGQQWGAWPGTCRSFLYRTS